MHLHVLQHVPFEGLGHIADWAGCRDAAVTWTRFHDPAAAALPAVADIDLLVVLGGPMGVHDETIHPWLTAEKRFLASALDADTPILGICLGAQLLAAVLGARVAPGPHREIGWFPVEAVPAPSGAAAFPPRFDAFHWHGDMFDIPPGAVHLARSAGCPNQAFQYGPRVIGLQFHIETTPACAEALLANCADELAPGGPFIQPPDAIRTDTVTRCAPAHTLLDSLLHSLVS